MRQIVIIGAGFGGLRTALGLVKKLKDESDYRVVLIDKKSYHTYTPSLYEVATAYRGGRLSHGAHEREFEEELAGSSCFVIQDIIGNLPITFIQDEVIDINLETRSVITKSDDSIQFEYCVIALGSEVTFFGVEGAHVCCSSLRSLSDALRIREQIERIFKNFFTAQKDSLRFVTVGAGFTGFELTTELAKYVQRLAHTYRVDTEKIEITLVEAADSVLPNAPAGMRQRGRKRLDTLGIKVLTGKRIVATAPNKVLFEGGEELVADLILWGGGIQGPELLKSVRGIELDKGGKIMVDNYLLVKKQERVFAIGDNSYFHDTKTDVAVPATAWAAEQQADVVIRNVVASIEGTSLEPYVMKFPGFVSAAGGKYAIAHIYGINISGFPAWVLKRLIDLKYILSLYSPLTGLKIWLKGLDLFTRND